MAVILGTAGHIDHGKTRLVQALTGIDCDRLNEEKRRGITIDLGFAWLDLANGEKLGIIDVPGHERFVRTMVAGAFGIDLVMLVIAADEGIMPQTREHLEICSLLGVQEGLVALTKIDMVENDWLSMVTEEVRNFLQGSFLENAPIFPVSSANGQGLAEIKHFLQDKATSLQKKAACDIFRLPVDRVFSLHGHGTVVTGTVLSGNLSTDEACVVMPGEILSRARSIERHGESTQTIYPGSRCAINLQGLEKQDIARGQIISKPGQLFASQRWMLKVTSLASAPFALKQRVEYHFHHASKECTAKLVFRDCQNLAPGQSALAEVLFTEPMCGVFADRCVLRGSSPLRTLAGALILSPLPPIWPKKNQGEDLVQRWLALPERAKDTQKLHAFVLEVLELFGLPGANFAQLRVLTALASKNLSQALEQLVSRAQIVLYDRETRAYLSKSHFDKLCCDCLLRAKLLHEKAPLQAAFARDALFGPWSENLPKKLTNKVIEQLLKDQRLSNEGEGLRLTSHVLTLASDTQDLRDKILSRHRQAGLTPPNYKDILEDLGIAEKEAAAVMTLLCKNGELVRIKDGLYYAREALEEIQNKVRHWFTDHDSLDIADLKSLLGLSRKYLIALLEYFDNSHFTMRVGDKRTLRKTGS
ncbi:MAG: selenocysteine-specific translation elongation factor [Desulfovibrio sp.]|nr:selenocysteine-specific translation elongation factor [Desulfovibrio sp.]